MVKKKKKMRIHKNTKYRIKTDSVIFKQKYKTSNPEIIIEDMDTEVFGDVWQKRQYVPAVVAFMMRQLADDIFEKGAKEKAYYGKVMPFGIGELVFKSELEEIK